MHPLRQPSPLPRTDSLPLAHAWLSWWLRLSPLARDVVVILLVKVVVLSLIWFTFFRSPVAPQMTMDPRLVEQNLLSPGHDPEPPSAVR